MTTHDFHELLGAGEQFQPLCVDQAYYKEEAPSLHQD
jgi:hypothetical protein